MWKQKKEYLIYGLLQERNNKKIIENLFNLKLEKSKNKYCHFDFYDIYIIELSPLFNSMVKL